MLRSLLGLKRAWGALRGKLVAQAIAPDCAPGPHAGALLVAKDVGNRIWRVPATVRSQR